VTLCRFLQFIAMSREVVSLPSFVHILQRRGQDITFGRWGRGVEPRLRQAREREREPIKRVWGEPPAGVYRAEPPMKTL